MSNCVPLLGVLFWGWDTFMVIMLYWSENVVIGLYNVLKMMLAKGHDFVENGSKVFLIPFFIVHYGMFTFAHGAFVFGMFGNSNSELEFCNVAGLLLSNVSLCFYALLISHGVSFVQNYIVKGEYKEATIKRLMSQPYSRIIILHLTIIFGGMASDAFGSPVFVLVILIFLKTIVDVKLHLHERKSYSKSKSLNDLISANANSEEMEE